MSAPLLTLMYFVLMLRNQVTQAQTCGVPGIDSINLRSQIRTSTTTARPTAVTAYSTGATGYYQPNSATYAPYMSNANQYPNNGYGNNQMNMTMNNNYGGNQYQNAPSSNGYGNNQMNMTISNNYGNNQYQNQPMNNNQYGGNQYQNAPSNNGYGNSQPMVQSYGNSNSQYQNRPSNNNNYRQPSNSGYGNNQPSNSGYGNSQGYSQNQPANNGNGNNRYGQNQPMNNGYGNSQGQYQNQNQPMNNQYGGNQYQNQPMNNQYSSQPANNQYNNRPMTQNSGYSGGNYGNQMNNQYGGNSNYGSRPNPAPYNQYPGQYGRSVGFHDFIDSVSGSGLGRLKREESAAQPMGRIGGGIDIFAETGAEVCWQASIRQPLQAGGTVRYCGGTIISSLVILTSADCLRPTNGAPFTADQLRVDTGLISRNEAASRVTPTRTGNGICGQTNPVLSIVRHPDASVDLALLILQNPIDLTNPCHCTACLRNLEPTVGEECAVSGFDDPLPITPANTDVNSPLRDERLKWLHVDVRANVPDNCQGTGNRNQTICAGSVSRGGPCTGDQGGPLVCWDTRSNSYYLAAVISPAASQGENCLGRPTQFLKISPLVSWIRGAALNAGIPLDEV